jgi:hypothetical protein
MSHATRPSVFGETVGEAGTTFLATFPGAARLDRAGHPKEWQPRTRPIVLHWGMDFEAVSAELFGAPREEFTALRDERARQAQADRRLMDRIAALRKPTVAAWLVNQVTRTCPEQVDRLAELGESLRQAHQRLAGTDLRTLSRERHELIELLTKQADWLARKAGYAFSDATARQLEDTFEAAVADPRAAAAVRAGQLSVALTLGASEDWLTAATAPAKSRPTPAKKDAPTTKKKPKVNREQERRRARDKAAAEEAARAQALAEQALGKAEQEAAEATERVAEMRVRLDEAIQAEREKRSEVAAARKVVTAARRTAKAAERKAAEP